jgi:hypothetical protein
VKEFVAHQITDHRPLMVISWSNQSHEGIEFGRRRLRARVPMPTAVVLPTSLFFGGRSQGSHQRERMNSGRKDRH